ncbi:MAG: hypothetical protein ACK4FP_05100 [Azonexus sp.]
MAIKPVKHFLSSHAGAPVLSGTAGSLIAVLDTCLVNGYNLLTLDSLVVVNGVLTGTKAGHGFVPDQVIATTANETDLTGEWTVTTTTSNTFNAVATGVPNTVGTGTLTAKAAPLGWSKVYSGTNKAVYRSNDPTSTGMYLRVDDTGTTSGRVVGYETMTDVDTGTGPFPTSSQMSGGLYWAKSAQTGTTARLWKLFGTSKKFDFFPRVDNGAHTTRHYPFGDFVSEKPGDAYQCLISGDWSYNISVGYSAIGTNNFPVVNAYAPRSYNQLGTSVQLGTGFGGVSPSGASGNPAYPSLANNGLILSHILLREHTANVMRALSIPGTYATPQALPMSDGDVVTDIAALPGRKLMATATGIQGTEGRLFIDITGPW